MAVNDLKKNIYKFESVLIGVLNKEMKKRMPLLVATVME